MSSEADLKYAAAIDTSDYDSACDHMVSKTAEASAQIASESDKIQSLLTNIPEVKIDWLKNITDVEEMQNGIGEAFAQINRVVRENETAIGELTQMYAEVTAEANKFANVPSMQAHYQELKKQQGAIKEVIAARKQAIASAKEQEKALTKETKALLDNVKRKKENATSTQSLRQRIKELEAEAALMVAQAQEEGRTLDQNKGRYREIIEELGRLKDIRGDIQKAGSVFANDENQIQGVIQGLSGLSGAFTAAQGAIGLFGSENEKLNEIMLKVQSLMAITMGLQQVQQVLNKDSTFSLVTLNAVKKLFGIHTKENAEALAEENAAIEDNIDGTKEDAATTESAAVAEEVDADATKANSIAKKENAGASGQESVASKGATASQNAHTGSMVAGTIATKALTAATKLLKLALISTGIGALVVLVGELVSMVVSLFDAEDEATKKAQELKEINEEGAKVYAKARAEIAGYIRRIDEFNGTQEQEKQLLKEVNDKYGEQFGYATSLDEAKQNLVANSENYCKSLELEAQAQAYLNKYVEAYINLLQVEEDIKSGKYHHWYNTKLGDEKADQKARNQAQADANSYLDEYQRCMLEAQQLRINSNIGGHTDPNTKKSGGSGSGNSWDAKKAAAEQKKLLEEYRTAVTKFIKDTNAAISQAAVDSMTDGYYKEINALHLQMKNRRDAWQQQLMQLATVLRDTTKATYMTKKGATEEQWNASEQGQRSLNDWANQLLQDDSIRRNYTQGLTDIDEALNRGLADIRDKYFKQMVNDFGTYNQKFEQLSLDWQKKIGFIGSAFPEFLPAALKQMEQEFASLKAEDFKQTINWDVVFGNLEEQSLQSLSFSLGKVKEYFAKECGSMTVEQIKVFQEAIDKMENEIASRNPFTAMHKSFNDIADAKTELVNALEELAAAQRELTAAQNEYNSAFSVENSLRTKVQGADREDETDAIIAAQHKVSEAEQQYQEQLAETQRLREQIDNGKLASDSEEYVTAMQTLTELETQRNTALQERNDLMTNLNDDELAQSCVELADAQDRLTRSETGLTAAHKRNTKAEQDTLTARNKVTKSYKSFATNLNAAGKVTTDVGKEASNLARVFSDDIADGMDKALDFIDEVLDATTDVISAIGDVGKTVAKDTAQVADAAGTATQATAQATATSISTVEKASVILTVISAALQIATAIANLFNNDDAKQKEIEKLQERIDQLQWELDNQDAVRLQQNTANALNKLRELYAEARKEVLALHNVTSQSSQWTQWFAAARYQGEIYAKTVEKIADYWAKADYTADKALGEERYKSSRKQLENLAEQQKLVYEQMEKEQSKKKTDSSKVQDYKNQIAELAEEMATLINDMLEDIIGGSAEDIAKTLGDAFIEAAKAGEDAMQAWGDTVNDIVGDILRQMMIQQIIEPEIGKIFDKYKKRWFNDKGEFQGFDAVKNSMGEFADDINSVSALFGQMFDSMPDELKQYFMGDEERQASERGIATASQDSVDENNARLTTIQSHTYTLVQGVADLNATGTQILDRLTNIDNSTDKTADAVEDMKEDIKRLRNTVDDITTQGIKLK